MEKLILFWRALVYQKKYTMLIIISSDISQTNYSDFNTEKYSLEKMSGTAQ